MFLYFSYFNAMVEKKEGSLGPEEGENYASEEELRRTRGWSERFEEIERGDGAKSSRKVLVSASPTGRKLWVFEPPKAPPAMDEEAGAFLQTLDDAENKDQHLSPLDEGTLEFRLYPVKPREEASNPAPEAATSLLGRVEKKFELPKDFPKPALALRRWRLGLALVSGLVVVGSISLLKREKAMDETLGSADPLSSSLEKEKQAQPKGEAEEESQERLQEKERESLEAEAKALSERLQEPLDKVEVLLEDFEGKRTQIASLNAAVENVNQRLLREGIVCKEKLISKSDCFLDLDPKEIEIWEKILPKTTSLRGKLWSHEALVKLRAKPHPKKGEEELIQNIRELRFALHAIKRAVDN